MLKAGVREQFKVSREHKRHAPVEYVEAVEKWARERGGHARLSWVKPPGNCWKVTLSYKVGDPRQRDPHSDGEIVLLHDWWTADEWAKRAPNKARRHVDDNRIMPGNYAYDLDELGVEGLIERLDKGNVLSGRGQFMSAEDAAKQQKEKHEKLTARRTKSGQEESRARALDKRRSLYGIPFVNMGVDVSRWKKNRQLKKESKPA